MFELLIRHAYQVSLLIVAVAAITLLIPRRSVHFRFVLWVGVLVKCLIPPIWGASWGLFCDRVPPATAQVEMNSSAAPYIIEHVESSSTGNATPSLVTDDGHQTNKRWMGKRASSHHASLFSSLTAWQWLGAAWCTVTMVMLISLFSRALQCLRNANRAATQAPDWLESEFERLRIQIVPSSNVRLVVTTANVGPALAGILRPRVILPQVVVDECSRSDVTTILAHELMHVRRGDVWISLLEAIARSIWWFHPLVRWACFVIGREAERCCDAEVIASQGISPARYARALLAVLEQRSRMVAVPGCPGVRPFDLTSQRMERIMKMRNGIKRGWWWKPGLVLFALLIVPGGRLLSEPPKNLPMPPKQVEKRNSLTLGALIIQEEEEELLLDAGPSTLVTPYNLKKSLKKLTRAKELSEEEARKLVVRRLRAYAHNIKSLKWDGDVLVVSAQGIEPDVMKRWVQQALDPDSCIVLMRMTVVEGAREDILGLVDEWETSPQSAPKHIERDELPKNVIRSERRVPLLVQEITEGNAEQFSTRLGELNAKVICQPQFQVLDGHRGRMVVGSQMPIMGPAPDEELTIEYVDEGIQVDVEPTIRVEETIVMSVQTSEVVSMDNRTVKLDDGKTFTYGIPEMTLTRVNTKFKIESLDGPRTFVLAGKLHAKRKVAPNTSSYTAIVVQFTSPDSTLELAEMPQPMHRNERRAATETAIPILGDIPYLGRLFRNTRVAPADEARRLR